MTVMVLVLCIASFVYEGTLSSRGSAVMVADHLLRLANRLSQLASGSVATDQVIHQALGLASDPLPHTRDEAALRTLLSAGYDVRIIAVMSGAHCAACWRPADSNSPRHGQWGATALLAKCGAVVRIRAALIMRARARR